MSTQGNADPIGLGIPVIVQGTWTEPRIYPDVTGILDNPGAAYARLRELGQGLFGQNGIGTSDKSDQNIGETLGTMIQQSFGAGAGTGPTPAEQHEPPEPGSRVHRMNRPSCGARPSRYR